MAIRDLLWACPICHGEDALAPVRKGERCQECDTLFTRDKRALITARQPGRPPLTRSPAEWLDRLPGLEIEERIARAEEQGEVIKRGAASVRTENGSRPAYFRGTYLNRIESFGPPRPGVLELEAGRLTFRPDEEAGANGVTDPNMSDGEIIWDLDAITAVQPSSSTLQINARGVPLTSIRVPGGSIRLWEELICAALRHRYRTTGRGEIVEFQPRICTRPAP